MISYKFKLPGLILVLIGIALTVVYSIQRIDMSFPVFAVVTSYFETKFFTIVDNNIFEELIILCYLIGFLFTSFSKEKVEDEVYTNLRGEAWKKAILANSVFLVFIVLFIYGIGFVVFLIVNLFSSFVLYHFFYWQKMREYKKKAAV